MYYCPPCGHCIYHRICGHCVDTVYDQTCGHCAELKWWWSWAVFQQLLWIVWTLYVVKYVDIVYCPTCGHCILSNMWTIGHCADCVDIVYDQTCGHCAELKWLWSGAVFQQPLWIVWTLYIVQHVEIVYCQICGQLDIMQIVLTSCMIKHVDIAQIVLTLCTSTIKHVDIVQSSNGCDLEQVTLSTLGRTLTDSHSPADLNI